MCISHFLFDGLKFVFRDLRVRAFLFYRRCVYFLCLVAFELQLKISAISASDFVVSALCVCVCVLRRCFCDSFTI